jgi:hypothetical protein
MMALQCGLNEIIRERTERHPSGYREKGGLGGQRKQNSAEVAIHRCTYLLDNMGAMSFLNQ